MKENELVIRSQVRAPAICICICFLALFFALASASFSAEEKKPPPRSDYVGDSAGGAGHQQKTQTYIQTAHHQASSWPSPRTKKGSFTPGSNFLKTSTPYLTFEMTVKEHGYFQ